MVISLEQGADLHMAQRIPLPLTVSCCSKIQIGYTFLVLARPGSPGQRAVKRVCECVCVCLKRLSPDHIYLGTKWYSLIYSLDYMDVDLELSDSCICNFLLSWAYLLSMSYSAAIKQGSCGACYIASCCMTSASNMKFPFCVGLEES